MSKHHSLLNLSNVWYIVRPDGKTIDTPYKTRIEADKVRYTLEGWNYPKVRIKPVPYTYKIADPTPEEVKAAFMKRMGV